MVVNRDRGVNGYCINCRSAPRESNQGLGVNSTCSPDEEDNEYDAYRKRMMLAYRFRPNPMVSGHLIIVNDAL